MKTCSKCTTEKPFSEFGKHKQTKDGYKSRCKICNAEEMRSYYASNSDSVKNSVNLWVSKNKDKHSTYVQKWALENAERKKSSNSLWKKNRKDLVNASTQKRRAAKKNLFLIPVKDPGMSVGSAKALALLRSMDPFTNR